MPDDSSPLADVALMRALFDVSREAILVADDQRRFVAANAAACELFGRAEHEILQLALDDTAPPEGRQHMDRAWRQLLEDGTLSGILIVTRPDGSTRYADYEIRASIQPGLHAAMLRDVTDNVLAERALAKEHEGLDARYRLIAEHASDIVFLVSAKGVIEWVSPSVEAATGWTPADLVGMSTSRFADPSRTESQDRHAEHMRAGIAYLDEMQLRTRDGRSVWMEFAVSPIRDAGGQLAGWVGAVRNVQARHDAEDALRESHDLLATVIGATDESIYAKDLDGRYLLYNAAAGRALGRSEAEVLGQDDTGLFPPDEAAEIIARDRAILADGVTRTVDEHVTLADGRTHWLLSTKGPLRAPDGSLMGLFGVSRDITDRVAAEQALRDNERRLQELYDGVDSMLFHRVRGADSTMLNPSAQRILGHSVAQLGDRIFWDSLIHPDDLGAATATWAAGTPTWDMQYRMRRADGEWIWVRDRGNRLYGPDGTHERTFGVVSDVTEFHAVEEALARANRLESLGRLASSVAHDFNNVLVGIGLIANWIEHHPGDPSVTEEVRGILEAAERGKQMTRSLLAFARGGAAVKQRTNVADFVRDTGDVVGRLLGHAITLDVRTAVGLPEVDLDRTGLSQVLLNLAVNARDAMPNGGAITIDVRRAQLRGAEAAAAGVVPGGYIRVSVADTGAGIAPELLDRIFEPWFTTKEGVGTGLGLATAYGFARANGGSITVESVPGKGTTFRLFLPTAEAQATQP